jgi:hypothetical protein
LNVLPLVIFAASGHRHRERDDGRDHFNAEQGRIGVGEGVRDRAVFRQTVVVVMIGGAGSAALRVADFLTPLCGGKQEKCGACRRRESSGGSVPSLLSKSGFIAVASHPRAAARAAPTARRISAATDPVEDSRTIE